MPMPSALCLGPQPPYPPPSLLLLLLLLLLQLPIPFASPSPEAGKVLDGFPSVLAGPAVLCLDDNINTDGIYPGKYTYREEITPQEQASVCSGTPARGLLLEPHPRGPYPCPCAVVFCAPGGHGEL
jgi:hypothetical protein